MAPIRARLPCWQTFGVWRRPRLLALTVAAVVPFVLFWAAGVPLTLETPRLQGFNISGGLTMSPEFAVLLVGLVVNAAANVAEIVRGGILSVPRGQWEAARALGLSYGRALRLIVLSKPCASSSR